LNHNLVTVIEYPGQKKELVLVVKDFIFTEKWTNWGFNQWIQKYHKPINL
jgi:hypothetical protein